MIPPGQGGAGLNLIEMSAWYMKNNVFCISNSVENVNLDLQVSRVPYKMGVGVHKNLCRILSMILGMISSMIVLKKSCTESCTAVPCR